MDVLHVRQPTPLFSLLFASHRRQSTCVGADMSALACSAWTSRTTTTNSTAWSCTCPTNMCRLTTPGTLIPYILHRYICLFICIFVYIGYISIFSHFSNICAVTTGGASIAY
jgi:hypothetical protein